ncbi:MAG: sensor domain-containing diguanylate cyclase, partial [Spirochaetota bacterium]
LVTGPPHIRFYAGYPLTVLGSKLGTLCIIDTSPRSLEAEDVELFVDLAEMVERELMAIALATVDELTQIPNRRGFVKLARSGLGICARQKIPSSLVFFDLDGFKGINDRFGHEEGDRALVAFAGILVKGCRNSDVLGRLGGDEFVLWASDASPEYTGLLVDRIRKSLDSLNRESGKDYELGFSAGIVSIGPGEDTAVESLLRSADASMYKEKLSGRRAR